MISSNDLPQEIILIDMLSVCKARTVYYITELILRLIYNSQFVMKISCEI